MARVPRVRLGAGQGGQGQGGLTSLSSSSFFFFLILKEENRALR